jgi:hypothetical protein
MSLRSVSGSSVFFCINGMILIAGHQYFGVIVEDDACVPVAEQEGSTVLVPPIEPRKYLYCIDFDLLAYFLSAAV